MNAKFDSDFGAVQSGNRIPGTYRSQVYREITWQYDTLGFNVALEGRHNSKVYVNVRNTDTAPSYTIFNLRAGFEQILTKWNFKEYLRVNDGNALFFEPAADRNFLLSLIAAYKFR
jgi:iron complex outermembrane receptor protein